MGKYKRLKKKTEELQRRIAELESVATVNSFCFGNLTFPEYVRVTEKAVSRLISKQSKDD